MTHNHSSKSAPLSGKMAGLAVVSNLESTAADGLGHATRPSNIDVVIAAGRRVDSALATRSRIWVMPSPVVHSTNLARGAKA